MSLFSPTETPKTPKVVKTSQEADDKLLGIFRFVLALMVMIMTAGTLLIMMFHPLPDKNITTITFFLGNITGIAGTIATYYFPSVLNRTSPKPVGAPSDLNTSASASTTSTTVVTDAATVKTSTGEPNGI
jgi:Na+/melibiose symporter-like transporter